jgi:hypothetical protein
VFDRIWLWIWLWIRFRCSLAGMNLDAMAREMTGDGKSPNLFFVSQGPKVVTLATSHKAAMGAAYALGNVDPVLVSDRAEGVLWANVKGQRQLARGGGGAAAKRSSTRGKREAALASGGGARAKTWHDVPRRAR